MPERKAGGCAGMPEMVADDRRPHGFAAPPGTGQMTGIVQSGLLPVNTFSTAARFERSHHGTQSNPGVTVWQDSEQGDRP